jgi:hypothetical protein
MSSPTALPALPGAADDPGTGPVEPPLLDELLDDAGPLAAHRDLLAGEHRDLVASLLVRATVEEAAALVDDLAPGDAGIRVVLAAQTLDGLRLARNTLLDVDAVDLVGVRLAVPRLDLASGGPLGTDPAAATRLLLDALDSSAPAWITVPPGAAAEPVLDVLTADGAENAALDVASDGPEAVAGVLRRLVDRDLSFRVSGAAGVLGTTAPDGAPGVLNLLGATRAALNGAEAAELAEILACRDPAPLTSALRRMSAADAAVLRAFLVAVEVPDAGAAGTELSRLGLVPGE